MKRGQISLYQILASALMFAVVSLVHSNSVVAGKIELVVRALPEANVEGLTVTPLQWNKERQRFEAFGKTSVTNSSGLAAFEVPPGRYRLEVTGTINDVPVLARSNNVVSTDRSPANQTLILRPLRIGLIDQGKVVKLRRAVIRSWGLRGETVVHDGDGVKTANLWTSQDTHLDLVTWGRDLNTVVLAYAQIALSQAKLDRESDQAVRLTATIQTQGRHWYRRPVVLSPANPPVESAVFKLVFPRGELRLDHVDGLEIVTNRPDFQMSYRVKSKSGREIASQPSLVHIHEIKQFSLGGKLRVSAYARVMLRRPKGKPLQKELVCDALLMDPLGIEMNLPACNLGWQREITFRGGRPLPSNPLDEVELGLLADPLETVRFKTQWDWTKKQSAEIRAKRMAKFNSKNFVLEAPRGWRGRAVIYLAQLERVRTILKKTTGRKGPVQTSIRWRLNNRNARAQVGGKRPWMRMPFDGIRNATDPFGYPHHSVHEMLHTFGYSHGEEMVSQAKTGRRELPHTKWYLPFELYRKQDVTLTVKPLQRTTR